MRLESEGFQIAPVQDRQREGYRAGLREAMRICDKGALRYGDMPRVGIAYVRKQLEALLEERTSAVSGVERMRR